ncbi:MAG: DUF3151 family protein [Geodermatophilaceae bacterium]|nr:DUF3151 family protein [Geodermatophilaceae bacterium]
MTMSGNLLPGPPSVRLPANPDADAAAARGESAAAVAAAYPAYPAVWAALALEAAAGGRTMEAYAYGRTGYHRGLDSLRKNGWKGYGPVSGDHPGNVGFLTCVAVLADAAAEIGEHDEARRLNDLLTECDPNFDPGPPA